MRVTGRSESRRSPVKVLGVPTGSRGSEDDNYVSTVLYDPLEIPSLGTWV